MRPSFLTAIRLDVALLSWVLLTGVAATSASPFNCTAFRTDGSASALFTHHRLYDFRSLSRGAVGGRSSKPPSPPSSSDDAAAVSRTVGDYWTSDWRLTDQLKEAAHDGWTAIFYSHEAFSRAQLDDGTAALQLSSTALANETQRSAEMRYVEHPVSAVSLRVRARITGPPGACAAFFTYFNDTQETDIEVLTRDPADAFHCSNQPTFDRYDQPVPGTSFNLSMNSNKTSPSSPLLTRADWITYRLDWIPGATAFFINEWEAIASTKNVPFDESPLFVSLFGNGGSWSGPMEVGQSARMEVQWVNFAFNSSALPMAQGGEICDFNDGAFLDALPEPEKMPEGNDGSPRGVLHSHTARSLCILLWVGVFSRM
jgi:hypothetical protein